MITYTSVEPLFDPFERRQTSSTSRLYSPHSLPRTILLIDDDTNLRWLQNRMLSAHGYHCLEAADGLAGLSIIDQYQPTLVLLDLMMPNMDGFTFLRTVRQHNREIGIIVLSALTARTHREWTTAEGVDTYLTKPIHIKNLLQEIERVSQLVALRKFTTR